MLRGEETTLSPTRPRPGEGECLPGRPCSLRVGGVDCDGTSTTEGAQVEGFELGGEWLSPRGLECPWAACAEK